MVFTSRSTRSPASFLSLLAAALLALGGLPGPATASPDGDGRVDLAEAEGEIPAFARKYKVSCSLCHAPFPRLTDFGETFAANGFELAPGESPSDTVATGDPLLRLQEAVPLALRFDAYGQALTETSGEQVGSDLQTPFGVKLLTGGQVADGISYYMYFFLSERGEVVGLEDAFVQFTDVFGSGIDAIVGQFQVSDPLFKRELRLEYADYQPYRVRVGDAAVDLTYDRGIMLSYSLYEGGDLVAGLVNGNGLEEGGPTRQIDTDSDKNGFLRYSHDFGPLRLGAYGYYGSETFQGAENETWVFGPDATVPLAGVAELNLQYLRREDDNAFFDPLEAAPSTAVDAAMAELIVYPEGPGSRLWFTGLFNWLEADETVMSLRIGEQTGDPGFLRRYREGTLGATYLLRRNVRLLGEVAWIFDEDTPLVTTGFARLTGGVVASF